MTCAFDQFLSADIARLIDKPSVRANVLLADGYESQGYLSFKEASDARLAAQEDFTDKLRALSADEESILRHGLDTVAKTVQDRLKLQDKLSEIILKRQKLERDAQQSNLERQIRLS